MDGREPRPGSTQDDRAPEGGQAMRLHDLLDYHARERPGGEFAVQGSRQVTYAEALAQANRIAHALVSAGLDMGDRAAILSKNSIEYVIAYFGASKAGVALVPLNYRLAPPEWAFIASDAGAKLLLAAEEYTAAVDGVRGDMGTVKHFVAIGEGRTARWQSYHDWTAGQPVSAPDRPVTPGHDVYQMYTSGTTGRPKGAMLTHAAVTANIFQSSFIRDSEPGDRVLLVAPVYHAAAAVTAFGCVSRAGSLYIHSDFVPAEVVRALSEERITVTTLVPAMIQACLVMVPDVATRRYDTLRIIAYGASPIAEQTLRRAMEVFQCEFLQGYGMTETTASATHLLPRDHERALRDKPELLLSAGRAACGTEVRVVDDLDQPVPNGTIGEIVIRGPQLMRGYWNQAEATADALRGGWMHTGDAGIMDDEGYVYIQDRVKDMIVSGGENVYPREIEEVLFQHPAIADAAVIGIPDQRFGEAAMAVVVLRQAASATGEEIMTFCRSKLGGFKTPRSVDFVAALPRNPSGKVLKRELREPYWKGHRRRVGG
jgi:acyl-CoA synthetase (AMP-forming)/AMP-acid ligase II